MATLYEYWLDIYRRGLLVVLTVLASCIVAWLLSERLPPIYQAKTVFYLPSNITAPHYSGAAGEATPIAQQAFFPATEEKAASVGVGILRSKTILARAASEFPGLSVDDLEKAVDIKVGREFMLEVYARDPDPVRAAQIANLMPQYFKEFQERQIRLHMEQIHDAAAIELAAIRLRLSGQANGGAEQMEAGLKSSVKLEGRTDVAEFNGRSDASLRQEAESLQRKMLEAGIQARNPPVHVVVVERATPSDRPVFPITALNVIVAGITGLMLGIYYALFSGFIDRSRHARIAREMEFPSVTELDIQKLKALLRQRQ